MSSAGPLRSTDVTPLPRYYQPLRHPLAFGRFPGVAGYTTYLAPPLSRRGEEGFSSCSMCPGHRAVAPTPPEGPIASAALRWSLLPSPSGCGLGLRVFALSGPPLRSLALRPGDSPAIPRMTVSMGFRSFGFPPACHPGYGASALTPAGLTPAEHISLFWTHNRTCKFPSIRLSSGRFLRRSGGCAAITAGYDILPNHILGISPPWFPTAPVRLPPFALWPALPASDYYGGSVTRGLAPRRRSRV